MLIGEDFTEIVLEFNGLIIQEPNAPITDLLMGSMSIFFALRLRKRKLNILLKYWYYFFLTLASGQFVVDSYAFFLYTGPQGKFPTWISAILSAYFIEKQ